MCSVLGEHLFDDERRGGNEYKRWEMMGSERATKWVSALDNVLLCEAFLRSDNITKRELDLYRKFLPMHLDTIFEAVARCDGDGMKLPKLHGRLHGPLDIENYGPATGFDTEAGEHGHIQSGKAHTHKTQKRAYLQDEQQAKQYADWVVLDTCSRAIEDGLKECRRKVGKEKSISLFQGNDYVFHRGCEGVTAGLYKSKRGKRTKTPANWREGNDNEQLQKDVEKFLARVVKCSASEEFRLFNSYHPTEDQIYRAQPGKVTHKGYKWGWMDWAHVLIEGQEEVAQLVCFLEVPMVVEDYKNKNEGSWVERETRTNKFVVLNRSRQGQLNDTNLVYQDHCKLISHVTKLAPRDTPDHLVAQRLIYTIVPVERIKSPCICVPNITPHRTTHIQRSKQDYNYKNGDNVVSRHKFLHLLPRRAKEWKSLFVEKMENAVFQFDNCKEEEGTEISDEGSNGEGEGSEMDGEEEEKSTQKWKRLSGEKIKERIRDRVEWRKALGSKTMKMHRDREKRIAARQEARDKGKNTTEEGVASGQGRDGGSKRRKGSELERGKHQKRRTRK
jgi:hypothetical protein